MTILRVGDSSQNTDNEATMILTVPAGTVDDDVILFHGSCDGNSGYALPSGFTQISSTNSPGSHVDLVAYRIASSEPASYTISTVSGNERGVGIFAVYRGVSLVTPIDSSNTSSGGNNTSAVLTSLTPTTDDCAVVCFVGTEDGNNGNPFANFPAPLVEQLDNVNGPPGTGAASSAGAYADIVQTTATAVSGTIALVGAGSSTNWNTALVALTTGTPTVIGVDTFPDSINLGDFGIVLAGFGFEAVQGAGLVELTEQANYDASVTKVAQTIVSWADTSITFDGVLTGLADQVIFIHVTNDTGDRSTSRQSLTGIKSYQDTVLALLPDHYLPMDGDFNDITGQANHAIQSQVNSPAFTAVPLTRGRTQSYLLNSLNVKTEMPDSNFVNVSITQSRRYLNMWIRPSTVYLTPSAFYEEGGGINNIYIVIGFGNILLVNIADSTNNFKVQAWSEVKLPINRTVMVTIKFEGNGFDNEFKVFIDGVLSPNHDGNPIGSSVLSNHSGDISFGRPDGALDTGGTDISYNAAAGSSESEWCTFSSKSLTPEQIRFDLFEMGVRGDITIASDTEANMQIAITLLDDTTHPNEPCNIVIEPCTDNTAPTFSFVNQIFDDLSSIHVQWYGGGTVTVVNNGTSNISPSKLSVLGGGIVTIQSPATFTIQGIINGAVIEIFDNEIINIGNNDTLLAGSTNNIGTSFNYSHDGTSNDIIIQMIADGFIEINLPFTLSGSNQTLILTPEIETDD